jgi:hypothetical protein
MSAVPSASTSHSNFEIIFNAALETYRRKTREDLVKHPLLPRLQSCDSPEAILTVLREQFPAFSQSQDSDNQLTKWVTPTVNVLYSFSGTLGGVVGLVNIRMFSFDIVQSNIYFSGTPTCQHTFHGDCCSPLSRCPSRFSYKTYFDIQTYRRLEMPSPAETSLLTSLTVSKDFSNGLRFTLGLNRLQL